MSAYTLTSLLGLGVCNSVASTWEREATQERRQLEAKYEGFFRHQADLEADEIKRLKAADQMRAERLNQAEKMEAARRQHVLEQRKQIRQGSEPWLTEQAFQKDEMQKQQDAEARRLSEKKFSEDQKKLRSALDQSGKRLDPKTEFGL